MSDFLRSKGIEVLSPYRAENLGVVDMVVVGNSISRGNPELEAVLERRLPFISLPDLIHQHLLAGKLPIVVSGTHGKTTTTAALTHVLHQAELSPGFLIGGLPVGWEAGFGAGQGRWFVIEGDEYDSAFFDKRPKFLHYQPQVVVLNNIEFDHADIYASLDDIFLQFRRLIQLIPGNGCLIANGDEQNLESLLNQAPCPVVTFGTSDRVQVRGEILSLIPQGMRFKIRFASGQELNGTTPLWGHHQLLNLTGAAAAAEFAGVTPDQIIMGLSDFRGVRRRLELKYSDDHRWLYDDFAHHPTAVRATLTSLRARHPDLPIIAAFEPRSNTMVKHFFQHEIAEALGLADRIIVGGLHRRERVPTDQRLDVDQIVDTLRHQGKDARHLENSDEMVNLILQDLPRRAVIVLMSNGAFSGLGGKLLEALRN